MNVSLLSLETLNDLFKHYGYATVGFGVLLESTGLPLPGESLMIAAAIYAATSRELDIVTLVAVAAAGAICGDQIGYLFGRWIGMRVFARWGRKIGLTAERLDLGRYLFRRYGGRVVVLGRFVVLLRTFVAIMAGVNDMAWPRFLMWNALGGLCWTASYGFGAYALGTAAQRISGPLGIGLGIAGVIVGIVAFLYVKRNERRLLDSARAEMRRPARGEVPAG